MHEILHFVQNDTRGVFIIATQSPTGEIEVRVPLFCIPLTLALILAPLQIDIEEIMFM
jgi:hypothetical protein